MEPSHYSKAIETKTNITESKGTVIVQSGKNPKFENLYEHQEDAIRKLNETFLNSSNKNGILSLPTGGGKTAVAVRWVLANIIDKGKKAIWIAHRHELLEQAKREFIDQSYSDILKRRKSYNYHIISGAHDSPAKIRTDDDIIFASKDCFKVNAHGNRFLRERFFNTCPDVFVIIDEAHHACAPSYSTLISRMREWAINMHVLGLSATPFRTLDSEKGCLKQLFDDDIIYSIDASTLIVRNILSKPISEEVPTNSQITDESITEKDKKYFQKFAELSENIISKIAQQAPRNRLIVDTYFDNRERYGKTIIFAMNIDHAWTLTTLFNDREPGIAGCIVSQVFDNRNVSILNSHRKEIIQKFRDNEIKVIINVNMLTEGVDIPQTETVFLTRPTNSRIMLTQMIGRALRGPKAGGTDKAYIVSFIDNWENMFTFTTPTALLIGEGFVTPSSSKTYSVNLIRLQLLEELARLSDASIDPELAEQLRALTPLQQLPVGWYSCSLEHPGEQLGDTDIRETKMLIYENHYAAFTHLAKDFPSLFDDMDIDRNRILDENEKLAMLSIIEHDYLDRYSPHRAPLLSEECILDFIEHYNQHKEIPRYFTFDARDALNILPVAAKINDEEMTPKTKKTYIEELWTAKDSIWRELYGENRFPQFLQHINTECDKLLYNFVTPEQLQAPQEFAPYFAEALKERSLNEWPEPEQTQMREQIFEKDDIEEKSRFKYEIDYIMPLDKGGKTVPVNLKTILRSEDRHKNDK